MSGCRGAVAVTMDLVQLDINQCPSKYYTPNAFKNTHKCDKRTSYVSAQVILVEMLNIYCHSNMFFKLISLQGLHYIVIKICVCDPSCY